LTSSRKYRRLFEDADVKRWYDNSVRGSRVAADVYFRRLGNFCNHTNLLRKVVEMDPEERFNLLLDFVYTMEEKGHAGS